MRRIQGLAKASAITAVMIVLWSKPFAMPVWAQSAGAERGYATQPFTPRDFHLPDGTGCAGAVARWKAVQDNDYASGNIGLPVYHQIQGEIARADAACQAGNDAEAAQMVHASKARHGYPG